MRTTSSLTAALAPELPALADEIIEAIRREVPEYARPLRGDFGRAIRTGVVEALQRFGTEGEHTGVYRALGRGEHAVGRSLDALQSAYRVGARVAWRRLSRAAEQAGVPVAEQHALAEAIFAYIDELAAESVEGYAEAQADEAGDLQHRREEFLALLLGPGGAPSAALAEAAEEAGWTLPRTLAVLAVTGEPGAVARRLSGDCLHGRVGGASVVVVPAPTALRDEAAAAAARTSARIALGPIVGVEQARRSLEWATRGLSLDSPVVVAEERLADLLLASAPDIVAALRERALAPLADETPNSRARLAETLHAWLRHHGARAAIAHELAIHPQTVRYRVGRLRELFGEQLDDPEARFNLALALRCRAQ